MRTKEYLLNDKIDNEKSEVLWKLWKEKERIIKDRKKRMDESRV